MLINSWHLNEYESASMWKVYSGGYGICIQSTYSKLCASFKNNTFDQIHIGKVKYLDYDNEWLQETDIFYPFVTKRKSFESEKELRVISWLHAPPSEDVITHDSSIRMRNLITDDGKYVPNDLDVLIEKIYVSPMAKTWVFDLINNITKKHGIDKEVIQSKLFSLT